MNKLQEEIDQDLSDISSVLGAFTMSQAKFDDTYLNDLFDLDVDIVDSSEEEKSKIILQ